MGISSESYDIEGYKGPAKSASYLLTTTGIETTSMAVNTSPIEN